MNQETKIKTELKILMNVQDVEWIILALNNYYEDHEGYKTLQDDFYNIREKVEQGWKEKQEAKKLKLESAISEEEYIKAVDQSSNLKIKGVEDE